MNNITEDTTTKNGVYSGPTGSGPAFSKGMVPTSSWKMTSPKVYEFEIYGRSQLHRGQGLVSVGYRKAY